jgi:phospholipid N-methyltransferase
MNPWTTVSLHDYEGHMAFPAVGQAAMLADELGRAITEQQPLSVALLGCAGGNGLDQLKSRQLRQVVCLDINADFIRQLEARYSGTIPGLECHVGEVESFRPGFTVDLIFAGLIFEYTRLDEAIVSVAQLVRDGGEVVAILQLPAMTIATVTPSPYAEALGDIAGFFRYVDPPKLASLAAASGLALVEQRTLTLESGKSFVFLKMRKTPKAGASTA